MEYEDLSLGHFDSSEEFDDTLYLTSDNENVSSFDGPDYSVISTTLLPPDVMKEILQVSDLHTFVNLCQSDKTMRRLCSNALWQLKFSQHRIIVDDPPKTYNAWLMLYNEYQFNVKIRDKTYQFVDNIRDYLKSNNDVIYLDRPLSTNQLINIFNQVGARWRIQNYWDPTVSEKQLNDYDNARHSEYEIPLLRITNNTYHSGLLYSLTYLSFHEFIYQLFKQRYLH